MGSDAGQPVALVLTGGGARAAYQVGVLDGVLTILDPDKASGFQNPFRIICGTSAGAINAAAVACRAQKPHIAIERLRHLWESLRTHNIYKADTSSLMRTGAHWLGMLSFGWLASDLRAKRPHSLLDNEPLQHLLEQSLDFGQLETNIDQGHLDALAITATAYTSGEHLTFYQAKKPIAPWSRSLRRAVAVPVQCQHLLASSSIPFVFPAQAVDVHGKTEWCGDGSIRQLAPMSPAIHLGAKKIMVIGTAHDDDTHVEDRKIDSKYPTLAQIGGHALSSIFLDALSSDVERLESVNQLVSLLPPHQRDALPLRQVDVFAITPSRSLDSLAIQYLDEMPRAVRTLFRVLGVSSESNASTGGALLSYLLFESAYTQALIQLGRDDSMNHISEIQAFFEETQQ